MRRFQGATFGMQRALWSGMKTTNSKATADQMHAWLTKYTHGAPRTWAEIMGALSGAGSATERDDAELTAEQDETIGHCARLLCQLRAEGRAARECASDPRFDLWKPVG